MSKYQVELTITQTFTTKVIVEGDFKDMLDVALLNLAKQEADNMDHDCWDFKHTEFEVNNSKELPDFKLYSVGNDRPEYIVAMNSQEALSDHLSRVDSDFYGEEGPDLKEVPLNLEGQFETDSGYKTMTFAQYLREFDYKGPQLICWNE